MATTFNSVKKLLISGKVDEATREYERSIEKINKVGVSLKSVDILRDTSRYDAYVERTQDYSKYYLSTGFKELDDVIGGIDREEDLGVVVARTNIGKSWILAKMASAAAAQGLRVGLYSGEMSERKVGYRIDTLLGHINNGALNHGNDMIQTEYRKYMEELPGKYTGTLEVLTPQMINGMADVNALRVFIEKKKLDILFIDQLSLLDDQRNGRSLPERMANISQDLKKLLVLMHIPIISVSQQNRTKNDDNPDAIDTTQIAGSDDVGRFATFVIGITRDKKDNTIMTMHVVKSRDSANGQKLTYVIDLNKGYFTYVPEETEDDSGAVFNPVSDKEQSEFESRYNNPDDGGGIF
jgi:replicative DNA helicase